jgi:hypothetical protein
MRSANSRLTIRQLVSMKPRPIQTTSKLTSIAPYITNMKKTLAETPAQEEYEVQLPASVRIDHTVRVPPEMMPSEEQALHYFDYFFANVHPYCPVINKAYFYQQWQSARDSISPLMLEAIFACSTLMLGDIEEGSRWLALATSEKPRLYVVFIQLADNGQNTKRASKMYHALAPCKQWSFS